jgi:hypothetical protein
MSLFSYSYPISVVHEIFSSLIEDKSDIEEPVEHREFQFLCGVRIHLIRILLA